jgi:hypothetical protein
VLGEGAEEARRSTEAADLAPARLDDSKEEVIVDDPYRHAEGTIEGRFDEVDKGFENVGRRLDALESPGRITTRAAILFGALCSLFVAGLAGWATVDIATRPDLVPMSAERYELTREQDRALCGRGCGDDFYGGLVSVGECSWRSGGMRVCDCLCHVTNRPGVLEQR